MKPHRSLIVLLLLFIPSILFGQLDWTWYISNTTFGTDGTGPYIDFTLALKADAVTDTGRVGNFTVEGFFSDSLYDFGEGGGTESEDITVHRVPLSGIDAAIADWRAQGYAIDVRMLMLLGPGLLRG